MTTLTNFDIKQTRSGWTATDAERGIELSSPTRESLDEMIAKVEAASNPAPAKPVWELEGEELKTAPVSRQAADEMFLYWTGRGARHYRVNINDLSPHQVPADTVRRKHDLDSIQVRFERFHAANPHIYERLVEAARQMRDAGRTRIGVGHLVEDVIRWAGERTDTADKYRISNDYRSRYARLIMEQEPDLRGVFEIRQLETL